MSHVKHTPPFAVAISSTAGPGSLLALFFALTGTLIATSIANTAGSGVPFFYLAFLLPVFTMIFPSILFRLSRLPEESRKVLVVTGWVAFVLIATTTLQVITLELIDPGLEMIHLISRLCFLAYFTVALIWLRGELLLKGLIWLRRLLIAVCLYGAYQMVAQQLGWPLFLDWLRNNQSFFMYDYDTAGWVAFVRANSIYAEPSQATIPILILFMLNIRIKSTRVSNFIGWMSLLLFTIATFSRSAWAALLTGACVAFLFRSAPLRRMIPNKRSTLAAITLLCLLILPVWAFIQANGDSDLSAQERSGGIILGVHMVKDAPILGFGWNSFHAVALRYTNVGLDADQGIDFGIIHNEVVSYMQQGGLSGLALAALPFVLVALWTTAPPWMTCATLASFLIAAEFGDIGYSSLTWLWLAMLLNMRTIKGSADALASSPINNRPLYQSPVTITPHAAS
jgi:hypothetical protein